MIQRYERIYPPDWADKHDPRCPECDSPMFYAGTRLTLKAGEPVSHKVYQCRGCRRLFKEIGE